MQVGELFVSLGVKGSEKTVEAFTNVKQTMSGLATTSLETKAAIIGVLYAFERLLGSTGKAGENLVNFTSLTGMSAERIQQWNYAARQAGASAQEMQGSFMAVQKAMAETILAGKPPPEGFQFIASRVGIDPRMVRDTEYMMKKFQQFAQSVSPDIANTMLQKMGIGQNVIAAMIQGKFNEKTFRQAPIISGNDARALNDMDKAMGNMLNKLQIMVEKFAVLHGNEIMKLVEDLGKLLEILLKIVGVLTKIGETLGIFKGIDWLVKGIDWAVKSQEKANEEWNKKGGFFPKNVTPNVKPTPSNQGANVNIQNQNFNFQHDGKDHQKTGDSVGKAIRNTFRQMPAQTQGN